MARRPYNKYQNKKVWDEEEQRMFDSEVELERCRELRTLEKTGIIANVTPQPVFVLQEGFRNGAGKKILKIEYRSDFQYNELPSGKLVVEDVKGVQYNAAGKRVWSSQTAEFKLKWKIVQYLNRDIDFRLVERERKRKRNAKNVSQ